MKPRISPITICVDNLEKSLPIKKDAKEGVIPAY